MIPGSGWKELVQALADAVGDLEDRTFLTLSWAAVPTVYVQLEQAADRLTARTGADDVLPDDAELRAAARSALLEAGWAAPGNEPGGLGTWTLTLDWPARSVGYAWLADRCVAVFSDVHGVSAPTELEYRAWRDAEPDPVGVTFYPEDLEPAVPHIALPVLRLPDAYDG